MTESVASLGLTLVSAYDVLGLLLGGWVLLRGTGGRGWGIEVRRLAGLAVVLALVPLGIGGIVGGGFLILRLWCHALFCVLAPLALVRGLQRQGAAGWSLVVLALAAEGTYLWARRVEPFRLEVARHEIEVPAWRGRVDGLRVVVLSDLQTDDLGPFEARVFDEIARQEPDLLLIPGDLMQLPHGAPPEQVVAERAKLRTLFQGLQPWPRLGALMVPGDCEPRGIDFADCGVRMLAGEILPMPAERLQVVALSQGLSRRPLRDQVVETIEAFDGLSIVMGHAPEFALSAADVDAETVCVAGHTHGGQVQVPFFGPLMTLSDVPREIAAGGLHRIGRSWVRVSRGIGMERNFAPRIRFLCRPELVVLDLVAPGREGLDESN